MRNNIQKQKQPTLIKANDLIINEQQPQHFPNTQKLTSKSKVQFFVEGSQYPLHYNQPDINNVNSLIEKYKNNDKLVYGSLLEKLSSVRPFLHIYNNNKNNSKTQKSFITTKSILPQSKPQIQKMVSPSHTPIIYINKSTNITKLIHQLRMIEHNYEKVKRIQISLTEDTPARNVNMLKIQKFKKQSQQNKLRQDYKKINAICSFKSQRKTYHSFVNMIKQEDNHNISKQKIKHKQTKKNIYHTLKNRKDFLNKIRSKTLNTTILNIQPDQKMLIKPYNKLFTTTQPIHQNKTKTKLINPEQIRDQPIDYMQQLKIDRQSLHQKKQFQKNEISCMREVIFQIKALTNFNTDKKISFQIYQQIMSQGLYTSTQLNSTNRLFRNRKKDSQVDINSYNVFRSLTPWREEEK